MKKILRLTLITILLFLVGHYQLLAQFKKVEQTTYFQSRMDNPIKIEVFDRNGKYQFVAHNRSFYPYQLELNFGSIQNMSPKTLRKEYILYPGNTNLIALTIVDKNQGHSYDYSVKYVIGLPGKDVAYAHPYLIPVKEEFELVFNEYERNKYYLDSFQLGRGDTIYNMRKGYVTAVPGMYHSVDRLADNSSLEIMHDDGTIMIYKGIDPESLFVKTGNNIFPAQPLGIADNLAILEVSLYMNEGEGKLRNLPINYCLGKDLTAQFNLGIVDRKIVHPEEVITLEMTKRQKKMFQKGKLYE